MQAGIHGIILAGAHAWESPAFERSFPRALMPIANRALIDHALQWFQDGGIGDVRICANSDTSRIRQHCNQRDDSSPRISYLDDMMPRGPAGCLFDAAADLDAATLVVIEAGLIPLGLALNDLVETHLRAGASMTVAAQRQFSRQNDADSAHLTPVGMYAISRSALAHVPRAGYQDIKEMMIPRMYEAGESVLPYITNAPLVRIGGTGSCLSGTGELLSYMQTRLALPDGYTRRGTAIVHAGARISPEARLLGPVMIGEETEVLPGAMILGPAAVGDFCRIGERANISRAVLWDDVEIGPDAYVDRSILTHSTRVRAEGVVSGCVRHASTRPRRGIGVAGSIGGNA
ncbi:MAG TPA: NDP-sugar synthase [Phycisphaerae bacterium]|nr:NDP-sugar synthase [Phycisphaerae bacterium]